jgi:hypothetical protein
MADADVASDAISESTCLAITLRDRGQSCRLWPERYECPESDELVVDVAATAPRAGGRYLIRHGGRLMVRVAAGQGEETRLEAETVGPIYLRQSPAPEVLGQVLGVYRRLDVETPVAEAPRG